MLLLILLWMLVFLFWIWLRRDINKNEPPTLINLNWKKIYRFAEDGEAITDPEDFVTVSNACLQKDAIYDFGKSWIGNGLITASCSKFESLAEIILKISKNNTHFTDQDIREHVDTFVAAGEDTSSGVIMFCLVTVGSHPQVQGEIHKELQQIFGDEDRDVTKEDLSKLVYLDAVIKETLRFYPISPIVARYIDKDVKLRNCTLSKGHSAVLSIYGIHQHPMWGPDVDKFRPERWLHLPSNHQKYFPAFSFGRRDCIGFWNLIKEMSRECQKLGGVMKVPLGPRTIYVLTDPEDCLTVSNACFHKDRVYDFAKNWIGNGLITASDFQFEPLAEIILKICENNIQLTDQDIREHVDTFIAAGEDTSAGVIMLCLITVGSYPQVQKEIYKELEQIFGDEDRDVTKEDLSKLVYLEAVIKETMRFYPVVPIIGRDLDKDIKLSNCTLSKGRSAVISIYGIHRHPMWGPDPDKFKPERWLHLPSNSQKYFAAFGLGRRICIVLLRLLARTKRSDSTLKAIGNLGLYCCNDIPASSTPLPTHRIGGFIVRGRAHAWLVQVE
ncbi:unnamed protein product [Danaus chrysippus]|uniref:(African queen) hypothetical protein n=1 Tax=Danaus chrysippus TaxID=151541 RepID=A0A8J2VWG0_9NEOP|nr:unnamed protein product [Danaus chrysippus]